MLRRDLVSWYYKDNVSIKAGTKTEGKWSTCNSQDALENPLVVFLGWVTFGWIQQLWKGFFIPSCNKLLQSLWLLVIGEAAVFPCGETLRISLIETFKTGAHSGGMTSRNQLLAHIHSCTVFTLTSLRHKLTESLLLRANQRSALPGSLTEYTYYILLLSLPKVSCLVAVTAPQYGRTAH